MLTDAGSQVATACTALTPASSDAAFFPSITLKTLANKAAAGQLPKRTGDVFDTRDVADWWDGMRKAA